VKPVLRSLVPVICPPEAVHLADAIVDHMYLAFDSMSPLVHKAFEAGLLAYDLGAVARFGRRARALDPARAETYFRLWEDRLFGRTLNQLMSLSCYEQPEMLESIGYRPAPWIAEVTKKRLTVYADDVRAQERRILAPDPLRKAREVA
jgi:hypothetical protein